MDLSQLLKRKIYILYKNQSHWIGSYWMENCYCYFVATADSYINLSIKYNISTCEHIGAVNNSNEKNREKFVWMGNILTEEVTFFGRINNKNLKYHRYWIDILKRNKNSCRIEIRWREWILQFIFRIEAQIVE